MIKELEDKSNKHILSYRGVNLISITVALLIPSIAGFSIVLLITSSFDVIAKQLWSLPVIWPEVLYLGGLLGGFFGGMLGIWEISMFHGKKREIKAGKILSPDLYYIITLMGFTYILQFISDSQVPQSILFFLEIGFFLIIGWNLSKILLETETKDFNNQTSKIDVNQVKNVEIEKYKSE
ncbi:MAG: hypothetical protein KAT16_04195 [Candidatus Heimdallarchaeota archaeon]|nr:hypothetical protein [Candidatus Heimdallarchaeota archaeon]